MIGKRNLWDEYKKVLDPCERNKEEVPLTEIFNFFDSCVLEEFLEYLKSEYEE